MGLALTDSVLDEVARQFRTLGEPLRLKILQCLGDRERTVGELAEAVGGSQPNISRHLNTLHKGGLLTRRREGNSIYYGVADPVVFQLCDLVCKHHGKQIRKKLTALDSSRTKK